MPCRVCNCPTDADLCIHCEPAAHLLHPDRKVRLTALKRSKLDQRPFVMLAMLRAGHLWEGHRVKNKDLAQQIIAWLLKNGSSLAFMRWLAEDPIHGPLVWPSAMHMEPERTKLRLPIWLSHTSDIPRRVEQATFTPMTYSRPAYTRALAERLARAQLSQSTLDTIAEALKGSIRRGFVKGVAEGHRLGPDDLWRPDQATIKRMKNVRRWPIPLDAIDNDVLLCCSFCGEILTAHTPCQWCHNHPDDDPPTELAFTDILAASEICPRCGVDYRIQVAPVLCPCCHLDLTTLPPPDSPR